MIICILMLSQVKNIYVTIAIIPLSFRQKRENCLQTVHSVIHRSLVEPLIYPSKVMKVRKSNKDTI